MCAIHPLAGRGAGIGGDEWPVPDSDTLAGAALDATLLGVTAALGSSMSALPDRPTCGESQMHLFGGGMDMGMFGGVMMALMVVWMFLFGGFFVPTA